MNLPQGALLHAGPGDRAPDQRHEEGGAQAAPGRHRGRPHGNGKMIIETESKLAT